MNRNRSRRAIATALVFLSVGFPLLVPADGRTEKAPPPHIDEDEEDVIVLSPFCISAGGYGATPGGAQDINFFRSGAGRGEVPHPDTITAEGLLSQHDLPLMLKQGDGSLFYVQTAAMPVRFETLPEVRYLAQLGMSSGLRPETWKRAPLNLVAVVDKSGSMSGQPLALVRASLRNALDHLRDGDQLSIVLYGDTSHVFLEPTVVGSSTRPVIAEKIAAIESAGSTYMEAGLKLGYSVARSSAVGFEGVTRVMLFTDERPNVGNTAAEGFMGMAEAASRDGIGLTTIGVSVQFGADLATRISSVRGGNLFYFSDGAEMKRTFAEDFDTMVTELAHDFSVRIAPSVGLQIAGVFGVPGEMLRWDGDAVILDVATVFLSRRKGAIFFALAPAAGARELPARGVEAGSVVAQVDFTYRQAGAREPTASSDACRLLASNDLQAGLKRGACLIDEYMTLKKAATQHLVENDQEAAYRLVHGLLGRLRAAADPALADELKLTTDMHNTLALLSGHTGEIQSADDTANISSLIGVWRQSDRRGLRGKDEYVIVWPNGSLEFITVERRARAARQAERFVLDGGVPDEPDGVLRVVGDGSEGLGEIGYAQNGDTLQLTVSRRDRKPDELRLRRCRYADLPLAEVADREVVVDDLSGLPVQPRTIRQTGMTRIHRRGVSR